MVRFDPPLPLDLAGIEPPDGRYTANRPIVGALLHASTGYMIGDIPAGQELIDLDVNQGEPRFAT
ncbi:hypothetical protein [Gluconacetobacter sacchari]|uniref:Uncharacterized protein n=1 Tax=Gluconacetobacter sacchari TaxID=92759 RepID=A0A7W4IH21_9PROT|nr:hypothetical protein [Gluconacetobacter sacchari]MBB2162700.1 hypothetical protein [Gluconacetobacter sacchari]